MIVVVDERKVTKIENTAYAFRNKLKNPNKNVGIYCRVSSVHAEQLRSLANQASHCVKFVSREHFWFLQDIYIDIASGETSRNRPELQRLLKDCRDGVINFVVTRTVSRLSRDTVEMLKIIRELHDIGVGVMFEKEMINSDDPDAEFTATLVEAFEQAENEQRSENTRWGLVMRARDGSSKNYKRRCFGYCNDENGDLCINEDEAQIVSSIFTLYILGESLTGIIDKLAEQCIKTPTGKDRWSKNTIDKMLSNEKYCGDVTLFKTFMSLETVDGDRVKRKRRNAGKREMCCIIDAHPAIISKEMFAAVQAEKTRRSNVEEVNGKMNRKKTRYTSPKHD